MGRNSGGNRGGGRVNRLMQSVLSAERSIRMNRYESIIGIDDGGNILLKKRGGKTGVYVDISEGKKLKDAVITHNHPRALGKSGILAIGNSFSGEDLHLAVYYNAREIRAVTPTYTFSMKRPKGGWGVSPDKVIKEQRRISNEVRTEYMKYVLERKLSVTAADRAEVMHFHEVNKRLAKLFGWNYSKRRG